VRPKRSICKIGFVRAALSALVDLSQARIDEPALAKAVSQGFVGKKSNLARLLPISLQLVLFNYSYHINYSVKPAIF
jgi:hypothetical protein